MRRAFILTVALLGTALAAPGAPARAHAEPASDPVEYAVGDDGFFTVPDPLPTGEHGDLLRFQAIDTPFFDSYRIMYLSTSVAGEPIAVTGVVAFDAGRMPTDGYPMLLYGHGTIGIADHCAPSRALGVPGPDHAREVHEATMSTRGRWAVVATDYEGLGTPGRHPYMVGISAGRSILDAGRAARQLPGIVFSDVTGITGFSQGGHAALWAAQLAPEWTPEQRLVGTVLAAPASEVAGFASTGAANRAAAPLTVAIVGGLAAAYPEAEAALPDVLTAAGLELLTLMDQHCFAEPVAMPQGALVAADPATVEPFASLMFFNTPGFVATAAPVLIFHAEGDINIPPAMSATLQERLCDAGQVVERRLVPQGVHYSAAAEALRAGSDWLADLATGAAPPDNDCAR